MGRPRAMTSAMSSSLGVSDKELEAKKDRARHCIAWWLHGGTHKILQIVLGQVDLDKFATARLMILDFGHPKLKELTTASPTAKHILFIVVAVHGFETESAVASSACLHAEEHLDTHNMYLRPSGEAALALGLQPRQAKAIAKVHNLFYGLTNGPHIVWRDTCKR